jgi:hypothetical protein
MEEFADANENRLIKLLKGAMDPQTDLKTLVKINVRPGVPLTCHGPWTLTCAFRPTTDRVCPPVPAKPAADHVYHSPPRLLPVHQPFLDPDAAQTAPADPACDDPLRPARRGLRHCRPGRRARRQRRQCSTRARDDCQESAGDVQGACERASAARARHGRGAGRGRRRHGLRGRGGREGRRRRDPTPGAGSSRARRRESAAVGPVRSPSALTIRYCSSPSPPQPPTLLPENCSSARWPMP